jgi:uncharacterized protein (TIGR02996 family)
LFTQENTSMSIGYKVTEFAGYPVESYNPELGILLPTMPRREFRHTASGEFWAITLERDHSTVQHGPIGTEGKTTTLAFPTPASAREDFRKQITEKVRAGYAPVRATRSFQRTVRVQKFWEIDVHGRWLTIRSGKVGTDGKSETRTFSSHTQARSAAAELIAEKLAEGYSEMTPAPSSLREALIAALVADPNDQAARMAFADYLNDQCEQPPAVAHHIDGDGSVVNLEQFLLDPAVSFVQALVVGFCFGQGGGGSEEVVEALVSARDRLPSLRALFVGDLVYSDQEISWINQSDLTSLFAAFPQLEHFRARGGGGLVVQPFEHANLKSLIFEASGLPREVVRAVGASKLPALEHLELWLGTDEYGANTTVEDLAGILAGKLLPSLRYLGLCNSDISDGIAGALASAPLLKRLRVLDLSLGTLGDEGAEALLAIRDLKKLDKLDIHHHYVSPALVECLQALGIEVDASDPKEVEDPDDPGAHRYVAHAE